jgi:protein SCO1/2
VSRSGRRDKTRSIRQGRGSDAAGLAVLAAGVISVLLLAGGYLWLLGGTTPPSSIIGGHWSLTRSDGARVTDRDFHGRYVLIYFGYTSCPDVCPTTLEAVTDAMRRLGPRADRLQPLFITVDPARDTPAVVRRYVEAFGSHLIGLTGTLDEIARVEREYRIRSMIDRERSRSGYAVDHTAVLLLLGPDGRYLAPLPADESGQAIAARLQHFLS